MRTAFGLGLLLAFGLLIAFGTAGAAPADISYDQIQIMYFGAASPPPPGSFEAIRTGLSSQTAPSDDYPPPAANYMATSMAAVQRMQHGVLLHVSYLGDRSRVDDPATQRATIVQSDKNEIIYLDLAAKTYRVVTGDAATRLLAPGSIDALKAVISTPTNAASPDAQVGTETIASTVSSGEVEGMTIDGIATHAIKTTVTGTAQAATGSCPQFSMQTTVVAYVDPTRDERPKNVIPTGAADSIRGALHGLSLNCNFSFAPGPSPVPLPDSKRFLLYTRIDTSTTVPILPAPITYSMLIARGNLHDLGPADAALFEIPAGFTAAGT